MRIVTNPTTVPLDARESFRFAFLLKCAEEGLDREGIRQRVAERIAEATATLMKQAFGFSDLANAGMTAITLPATVASAQVLGGVGLGMAGGGLAAKLTDSDADPELAKKYELIAAYRQQADRARRQAARVGYRPSSFSSRASAFGFPAADH